MTCTFGSRNVTVHLLKGAAAATLVVWAVTSGPAHPLLAAVALVAAVVLMRGCPMCWTVGLVETISSRLASDRSNR